MAMPGAGARKKLRISEVRRARLARADPLLSPVAAGRRRSGWKARALEAFAVVLAVRRVLVVERRQHLRDRQRRRRGERRPPLLAGRGGIAELRQAGSAERALQRVGRR